MIATRLLPKQTVTKHLHKEKCERIEDHDFHEHSYWKTHWGFHFTVPELGPDKMTPETTLYEILSDIAQTRPKEK